MKHLKKSAYFFAFIVLFFSCSKPADTPGPDPINPSTDCKLSKISYSLGPGNLEQFDVVYTGNNISQLIATSPSPVFAKALYFYDAAGHLIRKELYASSQELLESKTYSSSDFQYGRYEVDSTVYSGSIHFHRSTVYDINQDLINGQLTNFRLIGLIYRDDPSHLNLFTKETPTWTGYDITTLTRTSNTSTSVCTETITYDLTKENKFTQVFPEFVYQDLFNDYLSIRFTPCFYFSKHLVTKVTSDCFNDQVGNYTYTFNAQGLIKQILLDGNPFMSFIYTCD